MKNLKKGKFYLTHDGSKTGHPGMIYWKNDNKNLYLAFTTGTSEKKNKHFKKLKHSTSKNVDESYINKRPFLGKRKDFNGTELQNMAFNINDYEILITISKKEPRESQNIKKKDRHNFKNEKVIFK